MNARSARLVSSSVLTCALVLTGCSKPADAGPTTSPPSSASATGATSPAATTPASESDAVTGLSKTFSVVPPEGWGEATSQAKGVANVDLVVLSSQKVAGFSNNLVVLSSAGDQAVLDDELTKGRAQLGAAGRTLSGAPDKTIGGARATGFTTAFEQQGVKVLARSYGMVHDGRVYLLTLSSSPQEADNALGQLDELASTWSWTEAAGS